MPFTFTFAEILDVVIMTFAVGYIFHNIFRLDAIEHKDPLERLLKRAKAKAFGLPWANFWFACSVAAPAFFFHEVGHKMVALAFGFQATFHASYLGLLLGVMLTLFNAGFLIFVPALVSWSGNPTPLQSAAIAFAGPIVNLLLWFIAWAALKNASALHLSVRSRYYLTIMRKLNLMLFGFNMIPLPMFDGWSVYTGIFHAIFG